MLETADILRHPDSSMWEAWGELRQYVFRKVMSWVALDRGIRMADELGLPSNADEWRAERDAVHAEIRKRRWSERHQSFTQAYDDDALDAAVLAIPMVRFLPWNHALVHDTVRAIARELTSADGELVCRYGHSDGLEGAEGAFSIRTFQLAQALTMIGEREHAERVFRRMLRHANHVGFYSEKSDPVTGQVLGNFPQAFTHVALINCAAALARTEPSGEGRSAAPAFGRLSRGPAGGLLGRLAGGLLRALPRGLPGWTPGGTPRGLLGCLSRSLAGRLLGRLLGGLLGRLLDLLLRGLANGLLGSWRGACPRR